MVHLEDVNNLSISGFKRMKVGTGGWCIHMDTAMMIVLRLLAFPTLATSYDCSTYPAIAYVKHITQ